MADAVYCTAPGRQRTTSLLALPPSAQQASSGMTTALCWALLGHSPASPSPSSSLTTTCLGDYHSPTHPPPFLFVSNARWDWCAGYSHSGVSTRVSTVLYLSCFLAPRGVFACTSCSQVFLFASCAPVCPQFVACRKQNRHSICLPEASEDDPAEIATILHSPHSVAHV